MANSKTALLGCLGLLFCYSVVEAVVSWDNSPVCVQSLPRCEAQCPAASGKDYIFVCAAGSGPNGGPYVVCQCVAPAAPNPPQQQGKSPLCIVVQCQPEQIIAPCVLHSYAAAVQPATRQNSCYVKLAVAMS